MNQPIDHPLVLFDFVRSLLERASHDLAGHDYNSAIDRLECAVALCEQYPSFAGEPVADAGASLISTVRECVRTAVGDGRSAARVERLLARLNALTKANQ